MDDDDWQNCSATTESAVAEASSADSLQIQWQESNRRFYPTLNQIRVQQGVPPVKHYSDPIGNLLDDRTIFVKIQNESYPISCEILDSIFSEFGILIRIERLSSGFHSTIHFFEKASTIRAFESLNGRNIYDGCCKLELFLATSMESSSSNQESATLEEIEVASTVTENCSEFEDDSNKLLRVEIISNPIEKISQEIEEISENLRLKPKSSMADGVKKNPDPENDGDIEEFQTQHSCSQGTQTPDIAPFTNGIQSDALVFEKNRMEASFAIQKQEIKESISDPEIKKYVEESQTRQNRIQVNSKPSEFIIYDSAIKELSELVNLLIELIEIRVTNSNVVRWTDVRLKSIGYVTKASKLFVKMPKRKFWLVTRVMVEDSCSYHQRFGSRASTFHKPITWPFDRGRASIELVVFIEGCCIWIIDQDQTVGNICLVFDPGGGCFGPELLPVIAAFCKKISGIIVHQQGSRIAMPFDRRRMGMGNDSCREVCAFQLLVFDPGGSLVGPMLLKVGVIWS